MSQQPHIDGVLIHWGRPALLSGQPHRQGAAAAETGGKPGPPACGGDPARIEATVVRRAPQVMVKVTGGVRGMNAIAAHFRYISKNGQLAIEDECGETMDGKDALHELAEDWRLCGTLIDDRREAFNIMLSMPRATDPLIAQCAAREFAQAELADHSFVMVLHDYLPSQPVRACQRESRVQARQAAEPGKADLHRWRESFAEKLRGWGVEAKATRQARRGNTRNRQPLWRVKAS